MVPFCGWGSIDSRLQPLRGGSLLFTIQFIFLKFFFKKKKKCLTKETTQTLMKS